MFQEYWKLSIFLAQWKKPVERERMKGGEVSEDRLFRAWEQMHS